MRFNIRIKIRGWTLFGMLSKTQTMMGFTSLMVNKKNVLKNIHYCMWDLEGCSLKNAGLTLFYVQQKYNLGEIYITNDGKEGSFRAWSFTPVTFQQLVAIINDTQYVDYLFFKYTVLRGKATLRVSKKENRQQQQIVQTLKGKKYPVPKVMERVIYDTGLIKDAKNFFMELK